MKPVVRVEINLEIIFFNVCICLAVCALSMGSARSGIKGNKIKRLHCNFYEVPYMIDEGRSKYRNLFVAVHQIRDSACGNRKKRPDVNTQDFASADELYCLLIVKAV